MIAREFLESLAKLPSHYCREDSQKLYLETVITSRTHLNKVFQKYCDSKGKLRVSRQVLLKEMKMQNIAIYKPKKDQRNVCLGHKYGTVSEQAFREHEKRKEESIRPGSSAGEPQIVDLRCLQYLPGGSMSYKINYTDQWRPLTQRQRKNKADDNTIFKMCKAPMRITSTKWQHLQELKKVLPKDYHHFYDALPHGD